MGVWRGEREGKQDGILRVVCLCVCVCLRLCVFISVWLVCDFCMYSEEVLTVCMCF